MSGTNVISSKRSTRLDIFDYSNRKNDEIFRFIDLTTVNFTNEDLEYKFKNLNTYDYLNSIDFDKQSTLTYRLVDNCRSLICYTSLSKVVLCIKLSDYVLLNKKIENFKIFYNHELDVFTIDAIFQHNTLISLNISKDIFLNNNGEKLANFNIRKNALPKNYVSSGLYQLNNFFNIITLKAGGMLLVEKHLDQNHVPAEYTLHEYGVEESQKLSFWGYLKRTAVNSAKPYIKSVTILPNNKLLIINNQLEAQLYRLDVDKNGHVTSQLTLLNTLDLCTLACFKDKVVKDSEFEDDVLRHFKTMHSPDFSKFVIYYITHEGTSGYAILNYDIQSDDVSLLNETLTFINEVEPPVIKGNSTAHYQLSDLKITNTTEVFSAYKTDSFNKKTGQDCIEHVIMKYSDKKWRNIYSSKSPNNLVEDFNVITNETDISLYISNSFNLPKAEVLSDLRNKVHSPEDLQEYLVEASHFKEKFTSSSCSILFNASSINLPSVEYAYADIHAKQLNTYFVPKFSSPIIDESGFIKALNELFNPINFEKRPLFTYKLVRECLKANANDINTEIIKEHVLSKFDKTLFMDISSKINISECSKAIKKLIEYTVDVDVTSKYGNTVQEQQILVEYVAYKNYELIILYTKILLFFNTAEVKNADLLESLNLLIVLLRKRFKFQQCFEFNKTIIFDIFIEDSPSLNLQDEQNLIITSEYILTKIVIDRYHEWTDKYQLAFLAKDKFTKEDLQLFTDCIQTYDVNGKIQNIIYLKIDDYEKVYETALFDAGSIDLSEEVDEYDTMTQTLLKAPNNFEYLSTLLNVFANDVEKKDLSYKLTQLIIDNYLSGNTMDLNLWAFYKSYVPLLAQDGKFAEVITTMNTLSTVKNEDLLQQLSELINKFGRKYIKSVIRFNTCNKTTDDETNDIIPFAQFYIIKKVVFELIMNESKNTDIVMMDYIKLLLSYEDTQQALNFLYALIINDDDYTMKHQYRVTMKAVLSTLPEEERYVVDEEGSIIGMDILTNI